MSSLISFQRVEERPRDAASRPVAERRAVEHDLQRLPLATAGSAASSEEPIDARAWCDPEVVALAGISPEELERYRHPPAFDGQDRVFLDE